MKEFCKVVILGRPNTGKSTLFNRLLGRRRALVHDFPGVTRDRIEEHVDWWVKGKEYAVKLIDTGGLGGDLFSEEIKKQVGIALKEAHVVIFLLDAKSGITHLDQDLLTEFKRRGQLDMNRVIAVVNKVDVESHEEKAAQFYELGFNELLTVSAEHGRGMDDLKEAIAAHRPEFFKIKAESAPEVEIKGETEEDLEELSDASSSNDSSDDDDLLNEVLEGDVEVEEEMEESTEVERKVPRIAVVGRPNVGKSTLVNALIGQERMITSSIAGTTVDSIDSVVQLGDSSAILIDTAGIRRKSKTKQGIEVLSVVQTKKILERAHIAILVLDGETGMSEQDQKIGDLIEAEGCGIIIAMNKWDTQEKNKGFTRDLAAERIRKEFPFLKYAPIVFMSALRGRGLNGLGELVEEILHQRRQKLTTHEFSEWIREEATVHNPMNAKFYLCHQTSRNPPSFVCHVNDPEKIDISLRRHLVNALREKWGFMGNPIRMTFLESQGRKSLPKNLDKSKMSQKQKALSPKRQNKLAQKPGRKPTQKKGIK